MDTVIIQKDTIRLNSRLDEFSFGKANYFKLISKEGALFDGKKFSKWSFNEVNNFKEKKSESPEIVNYCGPNPLSEKSKTLLQFFTEREESDEKSEQLYSAVTKVVKAMTNAAENDYPLPVVGAGGIIVDLSADKVLFLPEESFKYSTNLLPPEANFMENTGWLNPTLEGPAAICFERAVIVYKLIAKIFPYTTLDEDLRTQDMMNKSFMPLAQCIEGINLDFAKPVNNALRLSYQIKSKKKQNKDVEKPEYETGFNFDLLKEAWEYTKTLSFTREEISEKAISYVKIQNAKNVAMKKTKTFLIIFILIFVVGTFLCYFLFNKSDKQKAQYTSKGLTSAETVQGFFYGVNSLSTDLVSAVTTGKSTEDYANKISELSLLEKQIAGFTKQKTYYAPAAWLNIISDEESYNSIRVFGTTNLTIDGTPADQIIELHRENQDPSPITTEDDKVLSLGDLAHRHVEYYLVQTNPDDYEILVEKRTEEYTLYYDEDRWLIKDISSQQEIVPVNTAEFKSDYFKSLADNNDDIVSATASLKDKYDWLPTNEAMLNEQSYLMY